MNIWVVNRAPSYDASTTLAAFSDKSEAEAWARAQDGWYDMEIVELVVDQPWAPGPFPMHLL
jgi:hypothetical protein